MQDKYVLQGMLHPLTFDIDLHVFSFMIACNTIFGADHLTFNITLPPQTTFMNSSFTKCKHLFSLENDVLCVC